MVRNVKSLPDGRVKAMRNFFIGFGRFEPSFPLVHRLRANGIADALAARVLTEIFPNWGKLSFAGVRVTGEIESEGGVVGSSLRPVSRLLFAGPLKK